MKIKELLNSVLKKIKPSENELRKEREFAEKLVRQIRELEGRHVATELAGSVARGTQLRGSRDIDVFVMFPKKMNREEFEREGLRIGKKVFRGKQWELAYTEHPYVKGNIEGFDVEIIPSYRIKSTAELKSAVDRSPFHNHYLQSKLTDGQKDEVRLLKQFLRGIGCYGAEIKVSSVPGYVVELLVLKYGGFEKAIRAISKWRKGEVIDLESQWAEEDARKKFNWHLVVVDPTDKNRNVAAALSFDQYCRMIASARAFLKNPSRKFFFGRKEKPWSVKKLKGMLGRKAIIAISMPYPRKVVADIVHGQIKRLRKKVVSQLELQEFKINRGEEWTDEEKEIVIVIDLENVTIQQITKHAGPEVTDLESSMRFLEKNKGAVSGPRIEKGRWVVEKKRKYWNAEVFIRDYLKKMKREEKQPIKRALRGAKVLEERGIVQIYKKNGKFADFLTRWLKGEKEFMCI